MRARLTIEAGATHPRVLDLSPELTVSLGRHRTNTVSLRDDRTSRFHAEIYFADGAWHVRDRGTTNGTKIDGERIEQPTRLESGQVIGIGSARLRFDVTSTGRELSRPNGSPTEEDIGTPSVAGADPGSTRIDSDGLTALFHFMKGSLAEATPHGLVTLALRAVQKQTQASVCGYHSLDAEDSELKVVLPPGSTVSETLSRQLTQKVRVEGGSVWLSASARADAGLHSKSLEGYLDAVCVPLRRSHATEEAEPAGEGAGGAPLGALHAYLRDRPFTQREVRFLEVLAGCLANALHVLRSRRALEADNSRLRDHAGRGGDELVGDSPVLRQMREAIARLARGPCTTLIEGESGVGKELVALALHRLSPRSDGPLVPLNCATLAPNMAEAELFGHEKGAFTGADRARPGLFVQADEGTLFLDEIGELSLESQARLLRVLENKSVRPVMGSAEIKVDVRVLAATNRDLEKEVREGRFRRDLYFRFVGRLRVPSLRDHLEDVPALAAHFLAKLNLEYRRQVRLSSEALRRLQAYSWPGNVRQLRSVLEMAVAMAPTDLLRPADLRLDDEGGNPAGGPLSLNLEELEAWAVREAMTRAGGVQVKAAGLLGIHRETLINKIKKYSLDREPSGATEP
jgi:Nif-specific regulatory protein